MDPYVFTSLANDEDACVRFLLLPHTLHFTKKKGQMRLLLPVTTDKNED